MRILDFGHLSERRDKRGNEDCVWSGRLRLRDGEHVTVACVADGVSGGRNGAEVAEMTVSHLKSRLRQSVRENLESGEQARKWADEWGKELQSAVRTRYPKGYCTLSAVVVVRASMLVLQVGDSAIFWVPFSGGVVRLTADHSVAAALLRDGKREEDLPSQAYKALDRAVGKRIDDDSPLLDVEVLPTPPVRGWLVAGSDGVFDYIGGIDIRDIGAGSRFAGQMLSRLMRASLSEGRKRNEILDNASLAVVGLYQPVTRMLRLLVAGSAAALMALLFLLIFFFFPRFDYTARLNETIQPEPDPKDLQIEFRINERFKTIDTRSEMKGKVLMAQLTTPEVDDLYQVVRVLPFTSSGEEPNRLLIGVEMDDRKEGRIVFMVDSEELKQGDYFVLEEDGGLERKFKFRYSQGQHVLQRVAD